MLEALADLQMKNFKEACEVPVVRCFFPERLGGGRFIGAAFFQHFLLALLQTTQLMCEVASKHHMSSIFIACRDIRDPRNVSTIHSKATWQGYTGSASHVVTYRRQVTLRFKATYLKATYQGYMSRLHGIATQQSTWHLYLANVLSNATWHSYLANVLSNATWHSYLAQVLSNRTWHLYLSKVLSNRTWHLYLSKVLSIALLINLLIKLYLSFQGAGPGPTKACGTL